MFSHTLLVSAGDDILLIVVFDFPPFSSQSVEPLRWNLYLRPFLPHLCTVCSSSLLDGGLFIQHVRQYFTAVGGESSQLRDDTPNRLKTRALLSDRWCTSPTVNQDERQWHGGYTGACETCQLGWSQTGIWSLNELLCSRHEHWVEKKNP